MRSDQGFDRYSASRGRLKSRGIARRLVAVAMLIAGCGSPSPTVRSWIQVKGVAYVVSVSAPTSQSGWLLGGDFPAPDDLNRVAVWSAFTLNGPWTPLSLSPISGRDGPNETILGFASPARAGPVVMLGSRHSPTEGYPRPSTWLLSGSTWREILANRELFGGPNIVSIGESSSGGLTSGPHGYHIAGTWIGPGGAVVASVWSSATGTAFTRNDTDPAFAGPRGSQSYGNDIADSASGLLMVGTTAAPTSLDPSRQTGTMWWSADGRKWLRRSVLAGGTQVALTSVRPLGTGWISGGSINGVPTTWSVGPSLHAMPTRLPGSGTITDLAVSGRTLWAAGINSGGASELWTASTGRGGLPKTWRQVVTPSTTAGWTQARLAVQGNHVLLAIFNASTSQVWQSS